MHAFPLITYLHQAVLVLMIMCCTFYEGSSQNIMLLENCGWPTYTRSVSFAQKLATPSPTVHTLVPNLVCRSKFHVADDLFVLLLTVEDFSLLGSDECTEQSERFILQFTNRIREKNITWCGKKFAKELLLGDGEVEVIYITGPTGAGPGFNMTLRPLPAPSCYYARSFTASEQPRLLYSPGYPGPYTSLLNCSVMIMTEGNKEVRVRSLEMDVEDADNCQYDALIIDNVKYCGNQDQAVNVVLNQTQVQLRFETDDSFEERGFVLEYYAVPKLQCDDRMKYITTQATESVVILEGNDTCYLSIDVQSSDNVVALSLLDNFDAFIMFDITVYGENLKSQDKTMIRPTYKNRSLVMTPFFLQAPSQRLKLQILLRTGKSAKLKIQTLNKLSLTKEVNSDSKISLIWINSMFAKGVSHSESLLVTGKDTIKLGVIKKVSSMSLQGLEILAPNVSDYLIPADYVEVYNGRNNGYFELTRDCQGKPVSDYNIYSYKSNIVAVKIRRNFSSSGFWLYTVPHDKERPPTSQILTSPYFFNRSSSQFQMKNLFCKWTMSASHWHAADNGGYGIKITFENNFPLQRSGFLYFDIEPGEINSRVKRGSWFIYEPTSIEVYICEQCVPSQQPLFFTFSYEFLDLPNAYSLPGCTGTLEFEASRELQSLSTPNYPGYFQGYRCTWTIKKPRWAQNSGALSVRFPSVPCSNVFSYEASTLGSLCRISPKTQLLTVDELKIELSSRRGLSIPGFTLQYHFQDTTVDKCNSRKLYSAYEELIVEENSLTGEHSNCYFEVHPVSYDLSIEIDQIDLRGWQYTCDLTYIKVIPMNDEARTSRLCGRPGESKSFIFHETPLRIELSSVHNISQFSSFRLRVRVIPPASYQHVILNATSDIRYVASPNYPEPYPSYFLGTWHIKTRDKNSIISIRQDYCSLPKSANSKASLKIYDGGSTNVYRSDILCGFGQFIEWTSTGQEVTVVFDNPSPNYQNSNGFRLSYKTLLATVPSTENNKSDSSRGVIGGVIGGLVVLVVIIVLLIFVHKRRSTWNRRTRACQHQGQRSNRPTVSDDSVAHLHRNSPIFMVNPVIINNTNLPPPAYQEIIHPVPPIDGSMDLPPYSSLDTSPGSASLSAYAPFSSGNTDDTPSSEMELPPPYSLDMPGGPLAQGHSTVHGGEDGCDNVYTIISDEGNGSVYTHANETEMEDDGYDLVGVNSALSSTSPAPTDAGYSLPNYTPSSEPGTYSLAQLLHQEEVPDYDIPPPAYGSEEFSQAEGTQSQQPSRRRQANAKNPHLGFL